MKNFNNIEILNDGGLKCDNSTCNWKDETIAFDDYKDWINKACPKCGENVLTEEDYTSAESLYMIIELINTLPPELLKNMNSMIDIEELKKDVIFEDTKGLENLTDNNGDDKVIFTVDTHKTIKISEINPEKEQE